jgi:hypothetical protein
MNPVGGGLKRQTKTLTKPVGHLLFHLRGRGVRLSPISTTRGQSTTGPNFLSCLLTPVLTPIPHHPPMVCQEPALAYSLVPHLQTPAELPLLGPLNAAYGAAHGPKCAG